MTFMILEDCKQHLNAPCKHLRFIPRNKCLNIVLHPKASGSSQQSCLLPLRWMLGGKRWRGSQRWHWRKRQPLFPCVRQDAQVPSLPPSTAVPAQWGHSLSPAAALSLLLESVVGCKKSRLQNELMWDGLRFCPLESARPRHESQSQLCDSWPEFPLFPYL